MFLLVLFQEENSFLDDTIITAIIGLIGTMVALIVTTIVNIITSNKLLKNNNNLIRRNDLIEEKRRLEKKLNEFYIPLRHHLENSKTLFKIFQKDKPQNFRTLTHLLDPRKLYDGSVQVELSKNDKALLERIFAIGTEMEEIIYQLGYLIGDDKEFVKKYKPREKYAHIQYEKDMTLLSLLVSHLTVIRMAYNQDLSGQLDKFQGFVFPNEINVRVEEKISELEGQVKRCDKKIEKILF
jgi:hypothetical protein